MSQPLPEENVREVDFFTGTSFAVGEIEIGIMKLVSNLDELKQGQKHRHAGLQKIAAEQISVTAGQMKTLADCLVRVSVNHLNRRPRA